MALTVHQTYLTQNDCYRSGGALTPQGLMLHSVGCAQPDAMAFVQSWNQPGVKACVHGFIDANTLTVNVNRLRKTLGALGVPEDFLTTRRGVGYAV